MTTRANVVDFASYRFARDLRLAEPQEHRQPQPAPGHAPNLSETAAAHRERMLQHLAQSTGRGAPQHSALEHP